jgi:hypothetical protein
MTQHTKHTKIMLASGYVPAQQAADAVGRSLSTIHRWATEGKVDSARSGVRLFISINSLGKVFEDNEVMTERVEALRAHPA